MIHQTNISETTDKVNIDIDMGCSESSEALTLTTMNVTTFLRGTVSSQ